MPSNMKKETGHGPQRRGFIKFLEGMSNIRPKTPVILDNAPHRKSKAVQKLVEGAGGAVELIFPPAYAPGPI